jgi:putative selenium metabolism protein SsnA
MKASKKYIIGNGPIADGVSTFYENGALLICNGKIEKIGKLKDIKKRGIAFVDVKGRLIIPGLLNGHHHLYSFLTAGLSPRGTTDNFVQILENLWWRLDLALDEETTYYSALLGLIDSIKHGTTMVFDHHASMGYVKGSLNIIKKAFNKAGVKGLLAFETSNRTGMHAAEKHIEENISFFKDNKNGTVRGMMGLHANLTLDDTLLMNIAKAKPMDMPIHIHCGEDRADFDFCKSQGFAGPVDRLQTMKLLTPDSILAHCIHLSEKDLSIIRDIRPIIASNSESNANNRVGKMNRKLTPNYILGTDGMTGDMIKTLRSHYLLGDGCKESFDDLSRIFFVDRYVIQNKFFPGSGSFEVGNSADIAVLDYVPLTPINADNLLGHLIFGAQTGHTYITISNGKILYRDGKILFINEEETIKKAKQAAKKLHQRYWA